MTSMGKRAAAVAAAVAMIATVGPVAIASASTGQATAPASLISPVGPLTGPYAAGATAAIGGFNAGTDAAVGGWNAGASALGLPFQFTVNTGGLNGLNTAGLSPLTATP